MPKWRSWCGFMAVDSRLERPVATLVESWRPSMTSSLCRSTIVSEYLAFLTFRELRFKGIMGFWIRYETIQTQSEYRDQFRVITVAVDNLQHWNLQNYIGGYGTQYEGEYSLTFVCLWLLKFVIKTQALLNPLDKEMNIYFYCHFYRYSHWSGFKPTLPVSAAIPTQLPYLARAQGEWVFPFT